MIASEDRPSPDRLRLDADQLNGFLAGAFPGRDPTRMGKVTVARPGFVAMTLQSNVSHLRPGNLVSGPTQMGMLDSVAYMLVAAHVGPMEMAVTTSLNVTFLRGCKPGVITGEAKLMRLGRRLVTMDCQVWSEAPDKPSCHAVVTYALPG